VSICVCVGNVCISTYGAIYVYIYIYVYIMYMGATRIRRRLDPTRSQHNDSNSGYIYIYIYTYIHIHNYIYIYRYGCSNFTALCETWFSKNRSTEKFQAPFRQAGCLELFGRTMLAFLGVCVSIYLMCRS